MATFFGEILQVTSRAVDEDDDEDEVYESISVPVLKWSSKAEEEISRSSDQALDCQLCIISVGTAASGFTQAYMLPKEHEVLGRIAMSERSNDETGEKSSSSDKSCVIYRLSSAPGVIMCICNLDVRPEQSFSWTEQFLSHINLKKASVCIMSSNTYTDYKSERALDINPPFLRAMKTDKYEGAPTCPYLERPNIATGLAAQILTYCHIHQIAAVLYICYTDNIYIDSLNMDTFLPILRTNPLKDVITINLDASETLRKLSHTQTSQNLLYI